MNKKFYIDWDGRLYPLKKWIKSNFEKIEGYEFVEDDTTHIIQNKLIKLGWNSTYDETKNQQILHKEKGIEIVKSEINNKGFLISNKNSTEIINENELNNFIYHYEKTAELESIKMNLDYYLSSIRNLKSLGVINNKRDFTSQIGEWFVSKIVNGTISNNGIQKDWDIMVNDYKIQVKSHSKALTTSARWSDLKNYNENSDIDYLAILVFDESYKIQEFYFLEWTLAFKITRIQKQGRVINWSDLTNYRVNINNLHNNFLIKMFLP